MNDNVKHFKNFLRDYSSLRRRLPRMYGIEAVNLFKKNFDVEGFIESKGRVRKWKKPLRYSGRKTLTKTRRLRRGIKIKRANQKQVVVGVDASIKYGEIHNKGGKIPVTPKMRRYFWAMYKQTGDDFYKNMALTKKTHFEIPKRQYIGNTGAMKVRLDRRTIKELRKITQKYNKL